jgi:hypothetical protein
MFLSTNILQTNIFLDNYFYTDIFIHKYFYTQTLFHTGTFIHRRFYIETLLYYRRFYTQTEALYIQKKSQFYLSFWRSTLISWERVVMGARNVNFRLIFNDRISFHTKGIHNLNSYFYLSFWGSNLVSCERIAPDKLKLQFYFNFWRSNLVSRKGYTGKGYTGPAPTSRKK